MLHKGGVNSGPDSYGVPDGVQTDGPGFSLCAALYPENLSRTIHPVPLSLKIYCFLLHECFIIYYPTLHNLFAISLIPLQFLTFTDT